jgi:two-component system response regulator
MNGNEPVEILLVEDSQYDAKLTLRALSRHVANSIHVVHDGAEALDFVFATGPYSARAVDNGPTLILLDIKLPKIDGLEVLRRIRSDPRTTTQLVVLLTSSGQQRDIALAYLYHANSYIVKPVDFDQFTSSVRQVGLYWMLLNRPPEAPDYAVAGGDG